MITSQYNDRLFDITQLAQSSQLKELARKDKQAGLKVAAKQFESFFVDSLMKSMRQATKAIGESQYFHSHDADFFQQMFDQQLSQNIVQGKGLGISKMIETQLAQDPVVGRAKETLTQMVDRIAAHAKDRLTNQDSSKAAEARTPLTGEAAADEPVSVAAVNPAVAFEKTREALPTAFDDPVSFVKALWSDAVEVAEKLNVDPKLLIAQAALETGWGKSIIGNGQGSSFNLFNIKADPSWGGNQMLKSTLEYENGLGVMRREPFRSYGSFGESFLDYMNFLQTNPRYEATLGMTNDPASYLESLQDAGYATDPKYANKVYQIYRGDTLNKAINSLFVR